MAFQVNNQKWFVLEECVTCGCDFAVTSQFQDKRKEDQKTFFCPNGHAQSYSKSKAAQLQERIEQLETIKNRVMLERDEARAQANSASKKLAACKKKKATP